MTRKTLVHLPCPLVLVLCQAPAPAAELAGAMPAETVLYLEWAGTDAVRDAFAATALGRTLAEPEVQRFTAELDRAFKRFMVASGSSDELRQVGMGLQMARPLLHHLWHHRLAFSLIGTELTDTGPSFTAALAIELGDDADSFVTALQGLINMATMQMPKQTETVGGHAFQRMDMPFLPPIRYGVVDGVYWITLGARIHEDILAVKSGQRPSLADNAGLSAARKKLAAAPDITTLTFHLDLVHAREQSKPLLLGHTGSETFPPIVETLLEELGINRIRTLTCTGQLVDGGLRHAAFIATDGPLTGVLKLFDAKPVTDEDFHAVPKDATWAEVANFDLPATFDETMRIVGKIAPEAVVWINETIERATGLKLREDVLALFDDGWAFFDAPSQGGFWLAGLTVVIEAKDADALLQLLDRLVGVIGDNVKDLAVSVATTDWNGREIHYARTSAAPAPVAPAWGAHGNRVVIALFPQMVGRTLDRMAASDAAQRCILANPDFIRARKLAPPSSSRIVYNDTGQGVADLYTIALPLMSAGCSYAAAVGVPIDVGTFPTQNAVTRHLFGDISSISHDEEGVLIANHGPLPVPVPSIFSGAASAGLLASIALPSLSRARELSKRTVSLANLRGLGVACQLYAYDHQEKFPPDLEALINEGTVNRKQLVSPRDPRDPPPNGSSFVYIAGQTRKSDPRNVLAYEPDFDGEGGNVLFVDGHVEWVKPPRHREVIDDTYKRLGRKPPDQ